MAIYRLEMDNYKGTEVKIESNNKALFNRLELAIEHIFKEFEEKEKKK